MTRIKSRLLLALGLLLLALCWRNFSLELVPLAFRSAGWGLLPLVLLAWLWMPFDVLCMAALLPAPRPWRRLFLLEWSTDGLARLIPSVGLAGEPFRYRHLRPHSSQPGRLVVLYRIFHAMTGVLATAVTASVCATMGYAPDYPWSSIASLSWAAIAIAWLVLLLWRPLPPAQLLASCGWKSLGRVLQISEVAFLLWLLGVAPRLGEVVCLQGFLAASTTLFAFVPGGLGVQETALVQGCVQLGWGPALGFQVGLLRRCRQLLWSGLSLFAGAALEGDAKTDPTTTGPSAPEREPVDHPGSE